MNLLFIPLRCVFITLTVMSSLVYAEDVCVRRTSCSCVFPNGTGIDLLPASKSSTFYSAQMYLEKDNGTKYELSTYYYHPCLDVLLNITVQENNTCKVPLALCRHVNAITEVKNTSTYVIDKGSYDYLGTSNLTEFSAEGKSITYRLGPSSTTVLLICAETENQLHVYSLDEPNAIVLSFYSRDACMRQIEDVGRSLGSTLLIIFFSFVIFYLVLGICTKKFLMGATGIEVIPNLGFWTDLPNLVKDGWAFAVNGFKLPPRGTGPTTSPDPNSYDSI